MVAVCETIAVSNTGAASKVKLFEKSEILVPHHIGDLVYSKSFTVHS